MTEGKNSSEAVLCNNAACDYRIVVKASTGWISVTKDDGDVSTHVANGLGLITIEASPKIIVRPCADPLDLSGKSDGDIYALDCSANELVNVEVSTLDRLRSFNCSRNRLTSLLLQQPGQDTICAPKALRNLDCSQNRLGCLHLSHLPELESVCCSDNQISTLDVKNLKKLNTLTCSKNCLPLLELIGLEALRYLDARQSNAFERGVSDLA